MSSDAPSVVATADGPAVVYRSRNLYSPVEPQTACIRRVAALQIPDASLVLVPSPVLGHGLEELLQKCGPRCGVFLVELESPLAELSRTELPRSVTADPRVTLCFGSRLEELEPFFPPDLRARFERVVQVTLSSGHRFHANQYERLYRWLQDEVRRVWQNRITTMHMGRLWFRNLFANLALLPSSQPIASLSVQRPTLVVGAGPSLDPLLPELRTVRRQLFLLAVDTAVPVLAAHDITPDAVVAVEPQHANLADFLGIDRRSTLLLADLFSFPGVTRLFPRHQRIFFSSRPLNCRLIERLSTAGLLPAAIPPLGSVGVAAVHLTSRICNAPVAFVGLDFAYPDGKTHARGAPFLTRELATRNRLHGDRIYPACLARPRLTAPDKHGGTCKTDMVLLSYAEQLRSISALRPDLYDLGAHGLQSGAPTLPNLERFLRRCTDLAPQDGTQDGTQGGTGTGSGAAEEGGVRSGQSDDGLPVPDYSDARFGTAVWNALERELQLTSDLEESITAELSGRAAPMLADLLAAADYLYADSGARPPFHAALLRRVLAAGRFYRLHLQRAMQRISTAD